jgi:hypothetical protein
MPCTAFVSFVTHSKLCESSGPSARNYIEIKMGAVAHKVQNLYSTFVHSIRFDLVTVNMIGELAFSV